MKKTFLFFLLAIVFNTAINAQNKPEYSIGFLLDKNTSEVELILDSLQEEIAAVVGEDAIINFSNANRLVNNFDASLAEDNYNTYLNSNIDIIIAFGVINNQVISKNETFKKPTILFGSVSEELSERPDEDTTTNIKNFTRVITNQSYTKDIKTLRA
jgi:hypothetical protein